MPLLSYMTSHSLQRYVLFSPYLILSITLMTRICDWRREKSALTKEDVWVAESRSSQNGTLTKENCHIARWDPNQVPVWSILSSSGYPIQPNPPSAPIRDLLPSFVYDSDSDSTSFSFPALIHRSLFCPVPTLTRPAFLAPLPSPY